ncbi:MFS transporter [Halovivax gelatinilyticus]|uniref:MFS transporter n=1 Tax=Halovivax gelatinilyticus TaxID=2961597 RepID=UPI0020CA3CF3|nr:MFS transporter [Halovivax gelatinilyticus]
MATDSVGFIWPIFTLFLLANDLSYTEIGLLSAVSAVLVVVFEIPSGYVADRIGRRNALLIGLVAMTVSLLGFVVAETFAHFVVLYGLWSISMAFHSGTADAWLYETLRESLREVEFARVRGRGGAVYEWTSATTMIVGGFLYVVDPVYPFLASAALHALGIVVVASMPQNARYRDGDPDARPGVRTTVSITGSVLFSRELRLFVCFVACFFAVVQATDTYIQPITEAVLADLLESVTVAGRDVPEPALLGVLYATFAVVGAIASDRAGSVRRWFGLRTALVWIPVVVAVALVTPRMFALLAIPVFVLMKGAYALSKPLVAQYVNDLVGGANRATVLSATSMSFALVRAPLKPVAGFVADTTSPLSTVALLGLSFLLVAFVIAARRRPVVVTSRGSPASAES